MAIEYGSFGGPHYLYSLKEKKLSDWEKAKCVIWFTETDSQARQKYPAK